MSAPSISAVIPMHNEAAYVARCLAAVTGELALVTDDWEVVVVDDASTDGTGDLVREWGRKDPRIRCVVNSVNLTLGGTLRNGFNAATKELVFYTDADLPFDLGLLAKAVRLLRFQRADLLVAWRFSRTDEGLRRTIYSFFWNNLVRFLLRVRVRDINFSFKLFHRDLLPHLDLKSTGSFIDAELVSKALHRGFHLIQFGVDYFPRNVGVSKLSSVRVIWRLLRECFALRSACVAEQPRPLPPRES
jgi:glycosyltransferase involved in cell wall biosynthesis